MGRLSFLESLSFLGRLGTRQVAALSRICPILHNFIEFFPAALFVRLRFVQVLCENAFGPMKERSEIAGAPWRLVGWACG